MKKLRRRNWRSREAGLSENVSGECVALAKESYEVAQDAYMDRLRQGGKLLWGNGILYDYTVPLSGGHSDDISLADHPDKGWGWLVDKGFDIIQTDWPLALQSYLEQIGKRYR